ncbi:uncharacterized protein V6R79_017485 [Siganus canaliculatus]
MDLRSAAALLLLLSLLGSCAGQSALPDGPVDAVLGKNVTLTTLVKDLKDAIIIWSYSDGSEQVNVATLTQAGVKAGNLYTGRVNIDATNGNLFLGPLKASDSGDYSVNIVNSEGTSTGEIKLRVLVPVSAVTIASNLAEAIEHNSTVVLTCTAKGSFLKYTWINGTTTIAADGKRIAINQVETDDASSSTLTITGVLRTDLSGPIYCSAANKLETEKSAPFNLTVYYGPEAVTIAPAKPPSVIKSGSDFNLTCSSVSSPPAELRWYHGQQVMEAAGPVLTLKVITAHGLGKVAEDYTCRASNQKTKRSVASPAVSFSVMDAVSGVQIAGPTGVLIAGNSSANISCQATKGLVSMVTWQKDGKPLSAGGRVVFGSNQTSILISDLQAEDNGQYTCRLGNQVNSEEASYKMVVNYGPEAAAVMGEGAVEVNDPVTLTCSASSIPPANYTWKYNGTKTEVKTATYTITSAVYKNTGVYTCEAHNAVTGKTATAKHTLSVKEEGALDEGLSDGAIAGIVIGVLIALALAIGLIFYCRQKVP